MIVAVSRWILVRLHWKGEARILLNAEQIDRRKRRLNNVPFALSLINFLEEREKKGERKNFIHSLLKLRARNSC